MSNNTFNRLSLADNPTDWTSEKPTIQQTSSLPEKILNYRSIICPSAGIAFRYKILPADNFDERTNASGVFVTKSPAARTRPTERGSVQVRSRGYPRGHPRRSESRHILPHPKDIRLDTLAGSYITAEGVHPPTAVVVMAPRVL